MHIIHSQIDPMDVIVDGVPYCTVRKERWRVGAIDVARELGGTFFVYIKGMDSKLKLSKTQFIRYLNGCRWHGVTVTFRIYADSPKNGHVSFND
jgi:hypothetical protein